MSVDGSVADGWEPVADVLEQSLADGLDRGAAVAVYRDGVPVVDVWGGIADASANRPWERDTVACVFSSTKGMTALCAHLLIERGELDLDAPVAQYWPEFAGGGKQNLKVRWVLTHQAGLLALDADLTLDDVRAVQPVRQAIEGQAPLWEPGTQLGYHAATFGFLVGELVRRVTGKTLGRFFADEIAAPLGLRSWIGLPEAEAVDLAVLEASSLPAGMRELLENLPADHPMAVMVKAITLGSAFPFTLVDGEDGGFNDRRVLAIELGSAGMVTDARSLARVYAATVSEVDGVRLLTEASAAACAPMHTSDTPVFGTPPEFVGVGPRTLDFGLGFIGGEYLGPSSFGHKGAGGSLAFADLDERIGFAYVMNRMDEDANRAQKVVEAVRTCL